MEHLLEQMQNYANRYHDGHYTIFKFTTHYKCCFGTTTEREEINSLEHFDTLKEAIINCLLNDTVL